MRHEDRIKLAGFFAQIELNKRFETFQKKVDSLDVDKIETLSDLLRDMAELFDDEVEFMRQKAAEFEGVTLKEIDAYLN